METTKRSYRIDLLKAISIIAVVIYHLLGGYGYLGVDVFFVISGYFMMKSILKSMDNDNFHYLNYLFKRIVRLWPMVLLIGIVSLGFGYFNMLPDDLENLSESIIASNFFANNILASITNKNYWDTVNTFKPLMHTWYVSVLMQAYVILPIFFVICNKVSKNSKKALKITVLILTVLSFGAYLMPFISFGDKFYHFPFRVFEITAGALVTFSAPISKKVSKKILYIAEVFLLAIILALFTIGGDFLSSYRLTVTVVCTALLLYIFRSTEDKPYKLKTAIANIGKCSFSIYICHQVIVAFTYYCFVGKINLKSFIIFTLIVAFSSIALYFGVEKPLSKFVNSKKREIVVIASCTVVCLITSLLSCLIYFRSGVVRDVPELGISTANIHRGMHSEYCDIPYSWDKDFTDSEKTKMLVIGNSFARDWSNILNESEISDKIEISYIYPYSDKYILERSGRIDEADFVFCSTGPEFSGVQQILTEIIPSEKLYVIGNKKFGDSNGIIYFNRNNHNYFKQIVKLSDELLAERKAMADKYGDHYIDMIGAVEQEKSGFVRVFTDDNYFISQDCMHLTYFGAKYYSRILDLNRFVK